MDYPGPDVLNDEILIKISQSFPQLQSLTVQLWQVTNQGLQAVASLPNLTKLRIDPIGSHINSMDFNEGLQRLAEQGRLQELRLGHFKPTPMTLRKLVRFCRQLRLLYVGGVAGISSTEASLAIVQSFEGYKNRNLTIGVLCEPRIWKTPEVKVALEQLEAVHGETITIIELGYQMGLGFVVPIVPME